MLARRRAGATRHGGADQVLGCLRNSAAHNWVVVATSAAAGSGGATRRSGREATAAVHVATRWLKELTSARISYDEVQ